MKKVFRPFWSYDVEKTEEWLSTMAYQGYHLIKINMLTRQFYFEEGFSKAITYTIGFDKTYHSLPVALVNEGWQEIVNHRHWYVIANERLPEEIKFAPVREGIVNHNRKIMYVFAAILLYLVLSSLPFLLLNIFLLFNFGIPVTVEGGPMWIVTFIVGISMWALTIYSIIKLYKTNQRLELGPLKQAVNNSRNRKEEKILKKSGKMIVKRRIGWFYSPDKLEKWLEGMEAQGYHLYRINKIGTTFFFIQGAPRKVSYNADYQNNINQSYFDMHQEAGWKLMFISKAFLTKWTIWSQGYEAGGERPQLYSDSTHMLKHAKRVTVTYLSLFIPFTIMYIALVILNFNAVQRDGIDGFMWFNFVVSGIVIIEFSTFSMKSWLYYRRTKRKVQYG